MPLRDIIDLTELNCGSCGGSDITFSCPDHGEQDSATLRTKSHQLFCIEYDYTGNGECSEPLTAFCNDCGREVPVEGLG